MLVRIRRVLPVVMLLLWDFISVFFAVFGGIKVTNDIFNNSIEELHLILFSFVVFIAANFICRCYNGVWIRVGIMDCLKAILAVLFTSIVMYCWARFNISAGLSEMSGKFFVLFFIFLCVFSVAGRFAVKTVSVFLKYIKSHSRKHNKDKKKIIIYGAGAAGSFFLEKISDDDEEYKAVGFADDNESIKGKAISGVKIFGGINELSDTLEKTGADGIVVAIPTISADRLEQIMNICKTRSIFVKRFASIDDASNLRNAKVQDVRIEDLLHRDSISLDMGVVKSFVKDRTVLVTGGAGSIGSEICRQVLRFGCKKLIVFDFNENGLFFIGNELKEKGYEGRFELRLGSIRDRKRLDEVFCEFSPEIVFHAAAHKHVPMMEINPCEAVKNNVFGTVNVCQEAMLRKVKKFILISTDKAVNPTNIMGATKRIAELIIQLF
ncbi:MAG: polysaccharide biosynthesis protein, partial [Acutalibacteraceae bacterium]